MDLMKFPYTKVLVARMGSAKLEEHLNLQLREHAEAALIAMVLRLGLSFGVPGSTYLGSFLRLFLFLCIRW